MSVDEIPESLRHLFSPERLHQQMQAVMPAMVRFLKDVQDNPVPALPWQHPDELITRVRTKMSAQGAGESQVGELATDFLSLNNHLQSTHYMGHQVPPAMTLAASFQAVAALANQGVGVYEMGPFAVATERVMIEQLGAYLGWPAGEFDAIVTHGGSLANLTALLTARNVHFPNSWTQGMGDLRPAILTSADAHYSVVRTAGILGLGADQVIKVPLNSQRQMDVSALPEIYTRAKSQGLDIFCLIGSACSTPAGAFDPLVELAQFARQHQLWFHVDGAHGAPFVLSPRHRHLVKGMELADSVTWDAHKMMYVPSLCTFLFYRDKKHSYAPFHQEAPYLFAQPGAENLSDYDCALRTLECTKGALATPLWAAWTIYGPQVFVDLIDRAFALTQAFYEMLVAADDFQPAHKPECNILCFRYLPSSMQSLGREKISDLQRAIRTQLVRSGQFYLTGTMLDGDFVLRVTLTNPLITRKDLQDLLTAIRGVRGASLP